MNTVAFMTHYDNEANSNQLWTPGVLGGQLTDVSVLRLLALFGNGTLPPVHAPKTPQGAH